jgi:hypothetical protein
MKTLIKSIAVIALGVLTLTSCKKNAVTPTASSSQTVDASSNNSSARVWTTGKQLYALGHNSSAQAFLYTLSPPPFAGGLVPTVVSGFSVSGVQVTNATGIAYTTGSISITTGATSNFPNRLLNYLLGSYVSPSTSVPIQNLTDIEYNEFDSKLYGVFSNNQIVRINPLTGAILLNLAPVVGANQIKGLCNYNGLLSYSISDNTIAADNFYSYNPASPAITAPLFSTDWGTGNGGMQYCNIFGWEIISNTSTKKEVSPSFAVTGPLAMSGGLNLYTDVTSN